MGCGESQKSVIYENLLLSLSKSMENTSAEVPKPQSNIIRSDRQKTAGEKEGRQSPTEKKDKQVCLRSRAWKSK